MPVLARRQPAAPAPRLHPGDPPPARPAESRTGPHRTGHPAEEDLADEELASPLVDLKGGPRNAAIERGNDMQVVRP